MKPTQKQIHDFGKKELKVLEEKLYVPIRETLVKRGLTEKQVDQVLKQELDRYK